MVGKLNGSSFPKTLEARLATRTGHPTLVDVDIAMRVLGQMQREYEPPNPDAPEGYSRVYILPEDEQPEGGLWTNVHLRQLLDKLENSSWRDEPYVPPPSRQPANAARRGYARTESNMNGNHRGFNPERSHRSNYGNDRGHGKPHYGNDYGYGRPRYHNQYAQSPPPSGPHTQGTGDRAQFSRGSASQQRWGDQLSWRAPGRRNSIGFYGPASEAANPSSMHATSSSGHSTGQLRPLYQPRNAVPEYRQAKFGYSDRRQPMSDGHAEGSLLSHASQYGRATDAHHRHSSASPSVEITARLEIPLQTPARGNGPSSTI